MSLEGFLWANYDLESMPLLAGAKKSGIMVAGHDPVFPLSGSATS